MDIRIKSFKSAEERALASRRKRKRTKQPSRGIYVFEFNIRDEEGKPQTKDGKVIGKWDWDTVSAGDSSVRVQDGWGI